jgi:hypothetical protein
MVNGEKRDVEECELHCGEMLGRENLAKVGEFGVLGKR